MLMPPPFQLILPDQIWGRSTENHTYPDQCNYRISIATPLLTNTTNGTFLRQSYSGNDFYLELWSFNAEKDGYINLSVMRPVVPLCLSLKNRVIFDSTESEPTTLLEKRYRLIFLPAGLQQIRILKGETVFLFIIPPIYLLEVVTNEFSEELRATIKPVYQLPDKVWFLKDAVIDYAIRRIIKQLELLEPQNQSLDLHLLGYIANILSQYGISSNENSSIQQDGFTHGMKAAHQTKNYILKNLSSRQIGNIQKLCKLFHISDKTLKREFILLTSKSIPDFIKEQRLLMAEKLLSETSLQVNAITHLVGYSEPSNFIRDFKKRFGYSPGQKKK